MKPAARETLRMVGSVSVACVAGAAVLGLVYAATERYRDAAALDRERRASAEMLRLAPGTPLLEVRQYLAPTGRAVIYRARRFGGGGGNRELTFTLDGALVGRRDDVPIVTDAGLEPLGRMLVATGPGGPSGFLVEGQARGYKNRIRFFVALGARFDVLGVRVVEHEEDPGLGAEIATPWFQEQYAGREAEEVARLEVTRDPMPEDWRAALAALARHEPEAEERHARLLARERGRAIYAVTGATISSRALTDGVRATVNHFGRRWALLAPHLGGLS